MYILWLTKLLDMSCTCACISLHATLDPPFVLLYVLHITLLSISPIVFSTLHFMFNNVDYIVFHIINTFHLYFLFYIHDIVVLIINKFQYFTFYVLHCFLSILFIYILSCTYYIVVYIINNFQHFTFY